MVQSFNDSYDCVILPYNHIDSIESLYNEFRDEFYSNMTADSYKPFQEECVVYQYRYSTDNWDKKIQWECLDSDTVLITACCKSTEYGLPTMTFYEDGTFPLVKHVVSIPKFWYKFRLSDRCIFDLSAQIDVSLPDNAETAAKFLSSDVQKLVLDGLIYDNKLELECVNILTFVFWVASKIPECLEYDESENSRRTKQEIKLIKNHHGSISRKIPLVKKKIQLVCLESHVSKIKRRQPDHKVHVRGHWRRYRDGSCVWINPFTKYNDKPEKSHNTYVV